MVDTDQDDHDYMVQNYCRFLSSLLLPHIFIFSISFVMLPSINSCTLKYFCDKYLLHTSKDCKMDFGPEVMKLFSCSTEHKISFAYKN